LENVMANLDTLAILSGHKSVSDMTDEELREHLRRIRHERLVPAANTTPRSKKSLNASKARTTKSPIDALLRSLSPEELEEMMKMLEEETP
jgi:DNA-binding MurR/RpiR family transcriptional regulator